MEDSSIYKEENQPCKLNKEIEQLIFPPQEEGENNDDLPREWKFVHNHHKDLILGDSIKSIKLALHLETFVVTWFFSHRLSLKTFKKPNSMNIGW